MMKRILIHFRGQMDEHLRPQGLTWAQLQLLKVIRDEPGASGAQLARSCYTTPQSAQALVKQLESGGWIRREKDRVNDRMLKSYLTREGEMLIASFEQTAKTVEARLWRGIDEKSVAAVNTVLEQCLRNLEPDAD
jgi:DNA-binding MarR family transcriptional regulator